MEKTILVTGVIGFLVWKSELWGVKLKLQGGVNPENPYKYGNKQQGNRQSGIMEITTNQGEIL